MGTNRITISQTERDCQAQLVQSIVAMKCPDLSPAERQTIVNELMPVSGDSGALVCTLAGFLWEPIKKT